MPSLVYFDTPHLYYLPQYLPVYAELNRRGIACEFVIYRHPEQREWLESAVQREQLPVVWAESDSQAVAHYQQTPASWIIFGNNFNRLSELPASSRTALLYHGIGVKDCYYDANLLEMDVRFVEGEHRSREIRHRFADARLAEVGFAKLDPLFESQPNDSTDSRFELASAGLDPNKPTLLYAPTFYPSSIELMALDWPAQFSDYNIIIKPHHFSLTHSRYAAQRERLQHWQQYDNVYLASMEDYSLLPFMATADLLISEASSALFEFAALDRPVIWCDFIKLRWSYRGPLRFRHRRRMDQSIKRYEDIALHVSDYRHLHDAVTSQLSDPAAFSKVRQQYSAELIGPRDGQASRRIVGYLFPASD